MIMFSKRKVQEQVTSDTEPESDNSEGCEASSEDHEKIMEPWGDFLKRTARQAEETLDRCCIKDWLTQWRQRQWNWGAKLFQQNEDKWTKEVLLWEPPLEDTRLCGRRQGRPKKRWSADFEEFIKYKKTETTWQEIATQTEKWKAYEEDFCNGAASHRETQ